MKIIPYTDHSRYPLDRGGKTYLSQLNAYGYRRAETLVPARVHIRPV